MGGAAVTQERIERHELQEDGSPWPWDEAANGDSTP